MAQSRRETGTRVNAIVERLEEDVLSGRLKPGDRLTEHLLAQRFDVSRTPVREALCRLSSSGLVDLRPRKGAVVVSVPVTRMIQMLEVMAELEGLCARLAARRMTLEQRRQLSDLHREYGSLVKAGDPDRYFTSSMRFHELIYASTQNPFLEELTNSMRQQVSLYRRYQLRAPGRMARSYAEHEAILKAIVRGDASAADRLMRRHIDIVGETFADFVSVLPVSEAASGGAAR